MATFQEMLSLIDAPQAAKDKASQTRADLEVARRRHEHLRERYDAERQTLDLRAHREAARELVEAEQEVARRKKFAADAAAEIAADGAEHARLVEAEYVLTPFLPAEAATDAPAATDGAGPSMGEDGGSQGGAS